MTDSAPPQATPSPSLPPLDTRDEQPATPTTRARRTNPGESWLPPLALAEAGLLLDVSIILDLAAAYLPLIGIVFAPAVPAPFALLMLRRGLRVSVLASFVSTFLVTVLAGPHFGWRMGLQAIVGVLIGWIMSRRGSPYLSLTLASLLIAAAGTCSTFILIVATGLPVKDVLEALRNTMGAAAALVAGSAHLLGLEPTWLSLRPTLVTLANLGLSYWPLLLFAYLLCFALPMVALYLAVATGMARVLGHDVRPFPSQWMLRLLWVFVWPLAFILSLPRRLRRLLGRRRVQSDMGERPESSHPGNSSGSYALAARKGRDPR